MHIKLKQLLSFKNTTIINEPQYIPTSASVEDLSVSNEYSDSDVEANKSGVFTDDEELEEADVSGNFSRSVKELL